MSDSKPDEPNDNAVLLAALADDFAVRLRRGEVPSIEEYAQKNALLADQIRELFPAMLVIEKSCLNLTSNIAPVSERVGTTIGRYRLLERLGEGGFGIVFMAEQQQPVRRKVALKVLKPGVDTQQVIARFEAERQALAMMEHENIAKVLDAGATESGRPYFVMELVYGIPITEYCDKNQLSPKERLALFILVCRAVQHAHTKGIIHRDIKPTNVLVTLHDGVPVPKVIDFGVAKATGQQALTERTLFTQFAQMVGTPLYMSPEQAELSGLDMDTRSDIYSLGVLLYELLTGTTPFDKERLRQAAHDEVRRIIREEEPPSPSTRISTLGNRLQMISADRKTEPKRLAPLVRGDLDWIVMKALEKDRKRRYETANGLATDVQRHLDNEPVMARPPSSLYRLQKLVARNKLAVTAVAGVVTALVLGTTFSVWQAARANAALADLRAAAPDIASQGRALAANDRFDEAIEKFDYASRLRPDVAAYIVAKADLLQSQLRLREAAQAYRAALHLDPQQPQVQRNLALCEQLGAVNPGGGAGAGTLSHESINTIYTAMVQQKRPVAELMHVARLVGKERDHFLAYWTERLEKLPLPSGVLLKSRLTLRDDGLLALDLTNSSVSDLSLLRDAPLGSLSLAVCRQVTQIEPLRGLPLRELSLSLTGVNDLTPLRDNRTLQTLILDGTKVTDISVLQGVPLVRLSLQGIRLTTLAPVARMALKELDLSGVSETDFSALAGLPLETLYLQFTAVGDLSFLRRVPLRKLSLGGTGSLRVRGLEVLRDIPTLETLILPENAADLPLDEIAAIEALKDHPNLKEIRLFRVLVGASKEQFWATWHRDNDWAFRLRKAGIPFGRSKSQNGTWILNIRNEPLRDLSILAGAPIEYLQLDDDQLRDLTPLKGMPLRILLLNNNPNISDLTPLQDMPLEELHIYRTGVSDLTALKKMPLRILTLSESASLRDLSPLAAISTLESVMLPTQVTDLEPLRKLPKLQWIGFGTSRNLGLPTTEIFWKSWDGLPWARKLEAAGVRFRMEQRPDGMFEVWVLRDPAFSDCSIFERTNVRQLSIDGTSVKDLRPLMELPLESLSIKETPVSDISPLRSPVLRASLVDFFAWKTRIEDFSPLTECTHLESLDLGYTGLRDLAVLRGLKLRKLWISGLSGITDISSLVNMPLLEHIDLTATPVQDISPLLKCQTLQSITLPESARNVGVLRKLPNLGRLSYKGDIFGLADKTSAEFWSTWTDDSWLAGLRDRGLAVKSVKLPNGTWDITLDEQRITDLTLLRGALISRLSVIRTEVSDLSPLREMPLTVLALAGTKVTDLRALEGMPLKQLRLGSTSVSDLTPLRSAKLTLLFLTNCTLITDLSPLREMVTLEQLILPPNPGDIEFLRAMPNISRISFKLDSVNNRPSQTAAAFWAEYDLKKAVITTPPAATRPARVP